MEPGPYCVVCVHWSSELDFIPEDLQANGPYPTAEAAEVEAERLENEFPDRSGWTFSVLRLLP